MTARGVVLFLLIALLSGVASADLQLRKNATADVLKRLGPRFDLDFDRDDKAGAHPTAEDIHAAPRTGYAAWLNAELARPDDRISEPPAAFRDYLQARRGDFWEIVAALEKAPPEWGERPGDVSWTFPNLLPTLLLERILLAVALCEELDGDPIAASRVLEASWSLGRSVVEGRFLIHQLLSVGISRLQAGALRKIPEPPLSWMNRLSSEESWTRMLDAVERESTPASGLSEDAFQKALHRLARAVAENFRKLSPCDASKQTDEEVWRAVAGEVEMDPSPVVRSSSEEPPPTPTPSPGEESAEPREDQRFYFKDHLTNTTMAIRRAAKLAVDRELTVKILELRLESEASREKGWPANFAGTVSHVCPGASYFYRMEGGEMEIRFDGAIESAGGEPVLPLAFHARAKAQLTPAPTPTPSAEAP
jgi:hypothetical protein